MGDRTSLDYTPIVGAWYYDAEGAGFPPHIVVFHPDGTLTSSNPDRGEANNSASAGMGVWEQHHRGGVIVGRFVEVNADPTSHTHTTNLIVDFTISPDGRSLQGTTFTGPATATYYNPDGSHADGPFDATLHGQRITLHSPPPVAHTG